MQLPRGLLLLLPLASAPSAGCGLFAGPNYMRSKADLPFSLGKVQSALWIEEVDTWDESEVARAELLLISAEVDCDDLEDDPLDEEDGAIWEASGILASVRYSVWSHEGSIDADDYDFEGVYWSGVDVDEVGSEVESHRSWWGGVFGEGTLLETYDPHGRIEITEHSEDTVRGTMETELLSARFELEHCGSRVEEHGDTGWSG